MAKTKENKGEEMNEKLKFLIDIVKQAEEISKEKFDAKLKDGVNDIVTNLDVKIENFLIGKIKENYPNFDIVSEEGNSKQELTDDCFVIDPIDGTINFANGLPLWGIQVACRENGKTIASVIDLPKLNEFYYADENGAFLNGEKISVRQVPIRNALFTVDGGGSNIEAITKMTKYTTNYRHFYAMCVAISFLASGKIHGVVFRADRAWDYLPGMYIAQQAGAVVIDKKGCHIGAMNEEFALLLEKETIKN